MNPINEKFIENVSTFDRTIEDFGGEADILWKCHDRYFGEKVNSLWYDEDHFYVGDDTTDEIVEEYKVPVTKIGDNYSCIGCNQSYNKFHIFCCIYSLAKDFESDPVLDRAGIHPWEQMDWLPCEVIRKDGYLNEENLSKLGKYGCEHNLFDGEWKEVEELSDEEKGKLVLEKIHGCSAYAWYELPDNPRQEMLYEEI